MSEQRPLKFVGQARFSSTLLFMVDSAKLMTNQLLEQALEGYGLFHEVFCFFIGLVENHH